MSRRSPEDRRRVAMLHQHDGLSIRKIAAMGYSKDFVQRWYTEPMFGSDENFKDANRSGRPRQISPAKRLRVAKDLESDVRNVVKVAAAKHKIGVTTVKRISRELTERVDYEHEVL